MRPKTTRVLIADDHAVLRQGLRLILQLEDDIVVVGEASNGLEAVEMARQLMPDVVLMDLRMPVMDGLTATTLIRRECPGVQVIALTGVLADESVVGMMRAGAIGYLMKDIESADLCRAIKGAAAGRVQLSPMASSRLMREVRMPVLPEVLTARETEVLCLVAKGSANKEIAAQLTISEKTVKSHVSSILYKLGLPSRTQAALYAIRTGLIGEASIGR